MFFMVGIIYDRVHHRNLDEFGGLFGKMPVYTAMALGIFFAGLGLPGLCGFIGEAVVVLSIWKYSMAPGGGGRGGRDYHGGLHPLVLAARLILAPSTKVRTRITSPQVPSAKSDRMTILAFCILLGVLPYQTVFSVHGSDGHQADARADAVDREV